MGFDLLKTMRTLTEIDFKNQASNALHFKIVLFSITVVSYLIARQLQDIMICVMSIIIGTLVCCVLFGVAMPWSSNQLEFKIASNEHYLDEQEGIAASASTQLSMVADE